jgi:hypothetical protein
LTNERAGGSLITELRGTEPRERANDKFLMP